jgi:hypothetical protein
MTVTRRTRSLTKHSRFVYLGLAQRHQGPRYQGYQQMGDCYFEFDLNEWELTVHW